MQDRPRRKAASTRTDLEDVADVVADIQAEFMNMRKTIAAISKSAPALVSGNAGAVKPQKKRKNPSRADFNVRLCTWEWTLPQFNALYRNVFAYI